MMDMHHFTKSGANSLAAFPENGFYEWRDDGRTDDGRRTDMHVMTASLLCSSTKQS